MQQQEQKEEDPKLVQDIKEIEEEIEQEKEQKKEAYREMKKKYKRLKKHYRNQKDELDEKKKDKIKERIKEEFPTKKADFEYLAELHDEANTISKKLRNDVVHRAIVTAVDVDSDNYITYGKDISVRPNGIHKYNKNKRSKVSQSSFTTPQDSTWGKDYYTIVRKFLDKQVSEEEKSIITQIMDLVSNAKTIKGRARYEEDERLDDLDKYKHVEVKYRHDRSYSTGEIHRVYVKFNKGGYRCDEVNVFSTKPDTVKSTVENIDSAMKYIKDQREQLREDHNHNKEIMEKVDDLTEELEGLQ